MRFSERYGYKSVRQAIQFESIDEPLRNGLWNLFGDLVQINDQFTLSFPVEYPNIHRLFVSLWNNHLKRASDTLPDMYGAAYTDIRKYFFQAKWYEVYDFIEFVAGYYNECEYQNNFTGKCNDVLEKELSAYRFIDNKITPITNQQEINEIEQAINENCEPIQKHLQRSLELFSDRTNPDYRNSIKESISAVESLVKSILGEGKGTLGQLIKRLEDKIGLHKALGDAFNKLYGYTSGADGIRHALLEESNIKLEDAKFFLVVCSAFINFVQAKRKSTETAV